MNIENKDTSVVASGKCSYNVTYTLDSNGLLTISGSGDIYNFDWNFSPFYWNTSITKIVIENGVTSIGDLAFYNYNPLKVYCVQGSYADNYYYYPSGSTRIYGAMPSTEVTTESTTEATTLAPIPNNLSGWVFDKDIYKNNNDDVVSALGSDERVLYKHWLNNGITEDRKASSLFELAVYKANYGDLQQAFGDNNAEYYKHFANYGYNEGRKAV